MSKAIQLSSSLLMLALAAAYPANVLANAAIAQFSVGEVSVLRSAANLPLANGGRVESGDLITTGNTGRTQLRFTDGGMVSLQPNSQFKITRYADAGDGKQDSFLVDLARGGMRALTGLIGKRNRDNYKVTTNTATIGIRGSGFSMAYNPDGTLGVTTEQDAIEVCTQAGCVGLNVGESALVTNASSLPTRTRERAHWNPPDPRRLITARNDDVNATGASKSIPIVKPTVNAQPTLNTNLAFAGVGLINTGGLDDRLYENGTALSDGSNFTGYQSQSGDVGKAAKANILNSTGSYATSDLLVLGVWQDSVWSGGKRNTFVNTTAFTMGQPTPLPQAGIASLFPMGATYAIQSATPVFSSNGPSGQLTSGQIDLDFTSSTPMSASLNINFASTGKSYTIFGTGTPAGATFNLAASIGGAACSVNCTATVQGFFAGPKAQGIGLTFSGNTGANSSGDINGAATFTRGPLIIGNPIDSPQAR